MKRFCLSVFFPLLLGLSLDQFSKYYIVQNELEYYINYGFSGGFEMMSRTHFFMYLSVVYSVLILTYTSLIYMFYRLSMQLCIWLSFLLAGFSSNVIDRYRIGGVIDFIKIPSQPVFVNVADLIQLLSFVFFLWSLKNVGVIRQNESRLFQLVYPKSQIRFALKYALTSLFSSLAISSFFIIFIRSLSGGSEISAQIFVSQTIFISLVFSIIFFLIGLIASIRWFGPIFAFSRFIDQIDEVKDFKLRQTDELKELEEISKKIIKKIGH